MGGDGVSVGMVVMWGNPKAKTGWCGDGGDVGKSEGARLGGDGGGVGMVVMWGNPKAKTVRQGKLEHAWARPPQPMLME